MMGEVMPVYPPEAPRAWIPESVAARRMGIARSSLAYWRRFGQLHDGLLCPLPPAGPRGAVWYDEQKVNAVAASRATPLALEADGGLLRDSVWTAGRATAPAPRPGDAGAVMEVYPRKDTSS